MNHLLKRIMACLLIPGLLAGPTWASGIFVLGFKPHGMRLIFQEQALAPTTTLPSTTLKGPIEPVQEGAALAGHDEQHFLSSGRPDEQNAIFGPGRYDRRSNKGFDDNKKRPRNTPEDSIEDPLASLMPAISGPYAAVWYGEFVVTDSFRSAPIAITMMAGGGAVVAIYDPVTHVGTLAHFENNVEFIDESVRRLLTALSEAGADLSRLEVKVLQDPRWPSPQDPATHRTIFEVIESTLRRGLIRSQAKFTIFNSVEGDETSIALRTSDGAIYRLTSEECGPNTPANQAIVNAIAGQVARAERRRLQGADSGPLMQRPSPPENITPGPAADNRPKLNSHWIVGISVAVLVLASWWLFQSPMTPVYAATTQISSGIQANLGNSAAWFPTILRQSFSHPFLSITGGILGALYLVALSDYRPGNTRYVINATEVPHIGGPMMVHVMFAYIYFIRSIFAITSLPAFVHVALGMGGHSLLAIPVSYSSQFLIPRSFFWLLVKFIRHPDRLTRFIDTKDLKPEDVKVRAIGHRFNFRRFQFEYVLWFKEPRLLRILGPLLLPFPMYIVRTDNWRTIRQTVRDWRNAVGSLHPATQYFSPLMNINDLLAAA